MSMIRPAPTCDCSRRTRRSRPGTGGRSIVIGIAFCGMLIECHCRRADLPDLRVRHARLDLGDVEDDQAATLMPAHVGAVAVVADREPVRRRSVPTQSGFGSVGLVRSTAAIVWPVRRRRRRRCCRRARSRSRGRGSRPARSTEHRVAAVLREVVDVDEARRPWPGCPSPRPAGRALVEDQRLVRRLHRRRHQPVGVHRIRGVRHVEHVDAVGRPRSERWSGHSSVVS